MLDHRHIIVSANGLANPPRSPELVSEWLSRVVEAVHMKKLMGPYTIRCETFGNVGVTGVVVIETSHVAIHVWEDGDPFLKMDLYSCAHFDVETVIDLVREFGPTTLDYMLIDRNGPPVVMSNMSLAFGR